MNNLRRTFGTPGLCLVAVGVIAVLMTLSLDARVTTCGQLLLKLCCAATIIVGIRRHRPAVETAWWLLVAYFALVSVRNLRRVLLAWTDGAWSVLQGNQYEMVFSVLGAGCVASAALVILVRRRRGPGAWALDDAAVLAVGVGLAAVLMVSIPLHDQVGPSVAFWNVGVVSVGRDVAVLIPAVALLYSESLRTVAFGVLTVSLTAMPFADLIWLRSSAYGELPYWLHAPIMGVLSGSQVAMGLAALHPSMREVAEPSLGGRPPWTPARTAVLGGGVLAPVLAVLIWSELTDGEFVFVMAGFAILLLAFVWRLRRAVLRAHELVGQVQFLADHDQLTALPNRRHLYGTFRDDLIDKVVESRAVALSCCYLDLDNLREINDRYEHDGGDLLLRVVARTLTDTVRPYGSTVVRIGGDEFVVLTVVDGAEPAERADEVAAAVTFAINALEQVPSGAVHASVGSSWSVLKERPVTVGRQLDTLIHEADLAQGVSKRSGGGRWTAFESTIGTRSRRRAAIRKTLPQAWDRGEMHLVYQPVVDLTTGETFGAESLLRWHSPELGAVPPTDAIEAAEELGLITGLGLQILQQGLRDVSAEDFPAGLRIGINLSVQQLRPQAIDQLIGRLIDSGLTRRVWLEVTEQLLVEERAHVSGALADLRAVGVLVAIDDFGTGYSGLDYLCTLPVDIVKLDGVFAREVEQSQARRRVARLAVQLADAIGACTIAEGLETDLMATMMAELGFTYGQGYALGRPVPGLVRSLHSALG